MYRRSTIVIILKVNRFLRTRSLLRASVLQDVLTDESASDEFCSIIRLSTKFILEKDYPSETDNPSRQIVRL